VPPTPWPALPVEPLEEAARAWTLTAVYARMRAGLGDFLTELRPTVALFLRLSGLDLVADPHAPAQLDAFIRWAQGVIDRYDASLLQVTVGDKGCYFYASFGAPVAHEDDARRAALAALELRTPPSSLGFLATVQIGISRGTARTGSYGGANVRTYGVLGDEINLAARLMQRAAPSEVLASERVQQDTATGFVWEALPPIRVKGRRDPVPVARLLGQRQGRAADAFVGELVGREHELAWLVAQAKPIVEGRFGGLLGVSGEPGMGKSRLVFELRRVLEGRVASEVALLPNAAGVRWLSAPCDGLVKQALNPLRFVLRDYFEHDPSMPEETQWERFDAVLDELIARLRQFGQSDATAADLARELDRTRSLLAALLDLQRDGTLYERLDPRLRFENTILALRALILAECRHHPLVLHLDDAHWLDDETTAFLHQLTHAATARFVVLLSGRPHEDGRPLLLLDDEVPQATLDLTALGDQGMRTLAGQILGGPIDDTLAALLVKKTSANPFFVEQLLLDLRERQALRRDDAGLWQAVAMALEAVPDSISAVLIARLDRLTGEVKAVVQTAAVLGNEFEVRVLSMILQHRLDLGQIVQQAEVDAIWLALSEIRYIFRHGLLRDAAYDMQLRSRLRTLHALAGAALEQLYTDELAAHAADLTYHYACAEDVERERRFATLAGEYAAASFANAEAVAYLRRALELTPQDDLAGRYPLLTLREQVHDRRGEREAQMADLVALRELADKLVDGWRQVEVALRYARYNDVTGDYAAMIVAAQEVIELADRAGSVEGKTAAYLQWARALWYQSNYAAARVQAEQALALAQSVGAERLKADVLRCLGNIAIDQGDYTAARDAYTQGLAIHRTLGDRQSESYTLNNLGIVAFYQGDYKRARQDYVESLAIKRETGDRSGQSMALMNLGEVATALGDYPAARAYSEQSLQLCRAVDDRLGESINLLNLGAVADSLGNYSLALVNLTAALYLSRAIGHRQQQCSVLTYLGLLLHHLDDNEGALVYSRQALELAREINDRNSQGTASMRLGHALLALGRLGEADDAYREALELREALGQINQAAETRAGQAQVALMRGDLAAALVLVEPIVPLLQSTRLEGVDEPLRVFLTCYEVLAAARDGRAATVLATGTALLDRLAARIDDEAARGIYLEDVAAHRKLRAIVHLHGEA
jgi:predicted ATPase/class 3 adenylate cyclase